MILCPDDHPERWSNPGEAFASVARKLRDEVLTDPAVGVVWVMVGVPGSGKSTWAKDANERGTVRPRGVTTNVGPVAELTKMIIIDACHADPKRRRALAQRILKAGKHPAVVWVQTPLSECIRRNAERDGPRCVPEGVIVKQHRAIRRTPPTIGEGWDDMIEVRP